MATIDMRGASLSAADPPIATNPNPDLAIKAPVRVATTGSNINLQTIGLGTIDGVALAAGDRVLVKDQTDQTTNGIYSASTGTWTRTIDGNNNSQWTTGTLIAVAAGTINAGNNYKLSTANPVILGTSNITFLLVTAATAGGATPTVKIGLAAVAGTALSFIRSDGAPAIDQAITPTWTGLHTFNAGIALASRIISSYSPVFDLAASMLGVNLLLSATTVTVAAGNTYNDIRSSQQSGANNTYTVGAGAVVAPFYSSPEALFGSSASSNLYGAILHATNDGPGNVRGVHLGGFANAGSTGTISAAGLEIHPVATTSNAWGAFASLTTSGVNGVATGYGIETSGDTYLLGFGSINGPVGYVAAVYRAWMDGTASSANARAFSTLQLDGTEIQYIKKTGEVVSTSLIAGIQGSFETNGIAIGAATINRTAAAGSMNISAGSNAGNVIQLATAAVTRLQISDAGIQITGLATTTGGLAVGIGTDPGTGGIFANVAAGIGTNTITSSFLNIAAATTAKSEIRVNVGGPPTSPVDGDIWFESNANTGLKIRINGVTKSFTVA